MKISTFLICFFLFLNTYSQSLTKGLDKYFSQKMDRLDKKEFILELEDVFNKSITKFNVDFENYDTIFVIRGLDIQNRHAYGRIWNNKITMHYTDQKKWEDNKIIGSDSKVSQHTRDNVTKNFDPIIKYVENGDFKYLDKYANEHSVLSGVNWLIIRFYRFEKGIIIDSHSLSDFGKL